VTVTHRIVNDLAILRVNGNLASDPDETALEQFRSAVGRLLVRGHSDIAINLSEVGAIDSEGVGQLASLLLRIGRRGGRLLLVAPSAPVKRVLAVTRLDTVFEVAASEEQAIERLATSSSPICAGRRT
jgi:anti-sigma B factor antagonist